jgi:hypothetical protein
LPSEGIGQPAPDSGKSTREHQHRHGAAPQPAQAPGTGRPAASKTNKAISKAADDADVKFVVPNAETKRPSAAINVKPSGKRDLNYATFGPVRHDKAGDKVTMDYIQPIPPMPIASPAKSIGCRDPLQG